MKKIGITISYMLAIIIALPIVLLFVWFCWAHFIQSPTFARTYFKDLLEFEDVAESRRWHWGSHPWGGRAFGCTYAIVNIPNTASLSVPDNWGDQWTETPVHVRDGRHDILGECAYLWSNELSTRLSRAHDNVGSYHLGGQETLLLYSPVEGIAARICFGD
jgi:hypothetical protein